MVKLTSGQALILSRQNADLAADLSRQKRLLSTCPDKRFNFCPDKAASSFFAVCLVDKFLIRQFVRTNHHLSTRPFVRTNEAFCPDKVLTSGQVDRWSSGCASASTPQYE